MITGWSSGDNASVLTVAPTPTCPSKVVFTVSCSASLNTDSRVSSFSINLSAVFASTRVNDKPSTFVSKCCIK